MAKKQSFADKASKKVHTTDCPVCGTPIQYIRHVKSVRNANGSWSMQSANIGVCKCNEKEVYA